MQVLEGTSPLKMEKKKKITAEIVATTSLPVDRLMATDCNAAARAKINKESCRSQFPIIFLRESITSDWPSSKHNNSSHPSMG